MEQVEKRPLRRLLADVQEALRCLARPLVATVLFAAVAGLVFLCMAATGLVTQARASGDANRSSCEPVSEMAPGFHSYLPDCRVYELVSPPYREGGLPLDERAAMSPTGNDLIVGFAGATTEAGNEPYDPSHSSDIVAYRLERSESGWIYHAITPSAVPYERSNLTGISSDSALSSTLWSAQTESVPNKEAFYLGSGADELKEIGPGEVPALKDKPIAGNEELALVGGSASLSRSLYSIVNRQTSASHSRDIWPGDTTRPEAMSLYEYSYDGISNSEPALVGVRNQGPVKGTQYLNEGAELISDCGTKLGSAPGGSAYNAVSENGETIFFTARACEGSPPVNEIYARIRGARTVAISEPSHGDCEACNTTSEVRDASFVGASANGERVFFMTEQDLLPGQEGMSLYEYDFSASISRGDPSGRIKLVSPTAKPQVQGVVRISEDGSHVYFVAKAALTGANSEGRIPEAGADNLYVYEPNPARTGESHVVFVSTLLAPAEEAEALEKEEALEAQALAKATEFLEEGCPPTFNQSSCFEEALAMLEREKRANGYFDIAETLSEDRAVWRTEDMRPAQATPDGRFLIFVSSANLTADDSSAAPQLFEYDAQGGPSGTGSTRRVSIGQEGSYDNDGNVNDFREAPQIPSQSFASTDLPTAARFGLALSDDGSRVFFTSAAPLTPLAVSGAPSLFEYREGNVYLISDGRDTATATTEPAVKLYGTTPSGSDVFFTTADRLVPQAADTQQALYDAREEGGFPAPSLPAGCLGETCRGGTAALSVSLPVGTVAQAPEAALETRSSLTAKVVRRPVKGAPKSRARALTRALRACDRQRGVRRRRCKADAKRRYGQRSIGAVR
jgi:hypothetical protein